MSLQPIFPLCFPSFGLSLETEEVTMVMEDTAYLERFFFMQNTQQGREEDNFILQAAGKNRMYSYLHTRKQTGRVWQALVIKDDNQCKNTNP